MLMIKETTTPHAIQSNLSKSRREETRSSHFRLARHNAKLPAINDIFSNVTSCSVSTAPYTAWSQYRSAHVLVNARKANGRLFREDLIQMKMLSVEDKPDAVSPSQRFTPIGYKHRESASMASLYHSLGDVIRRSGQMVKWEI